MDKLQADESIWNWSQHKFYIPLEIVDLSIILQQIAGHETPQLIYYKKFKTMKAINDHI